MNEPDLGAATRPWQISAEVLSRRQDNAFETAAVGTATTEVLASRAISRPEAAAEAIVLSLREDGIAAKGSDVISLLKIELLTAHLAAASVSLAGIGLS